MKNRIPKIIHQIWIGDPDKRPKDLMRKWELYGWEYKLWTEKEIDALDMQNRLLYFYFYQKGCYYGASDIVRLEVLKKYGGIYIDADTELLATESQFENAPFMKTGFFAVEANKEGRIANGIIGSIPEHPIITDYMERMRKAEKVEPVWSTIGGTLFTACINDYLKSDQPSGVRNVQILEPHTFYPFDSRGEKSRTFGEGKTYAQHFWGSTHKSYGKL